jgi:hypothetical protein
LALQGYKKKGQEELAWSIIKKMVQARIGLEVAIYREQRTNELLGELWPQFAAALDAGDLNKGDMEAWVAAALRSLPALEAPVAN